MKKLLKLVLAIVVAAAFAGLAPPADAQKYLVIGGGSTVGIYYQVALNVCKLVNEKLRGQGYNCIGRPALGSVFNVNAIRRGLLNFGVVQSDRNWQAYNGAADWKGKPFKGLRSVFSIHAETVMLMTRIETGIKSVNDLRGRRVNIGNPGSGQRVNAMDVLRIHGIDHNRDIKAEGLQQHEANRALVDRKIDAFFYTIGNPWGGGKEVSFSTSVRIIPVDTPGIRKFIADKPYYVLTVIPGGVYRGVGKDVPTYAVKATFVTSNKEPNDVVYNVTKTIFANLDRFRGMHAAFRYLRPKDMLKGLSAPFHPGAVRYYKEKGLM